MQPRHPQPGRAGEGSGTRPCDERFVPPLLSHPQAAGREKHPRLAEAQNPSRCSKSALCVCRALQTLGVRAVPSPLWVATVWEIRGEKQSRAGKELEPSERIGGNSAGACSTGRSRSLCPSCRGCVGRAAADPPPGVAHLGDRRARGGLRGGRRGKAAWVLGSHSAPQHGLPFPSEPMARQGLSCIPVGCLGTDPSASGAGSWRVLGAAPWGAQRFGSQPPDRAAPSPWQAVSGSALPGRSRAPLAHGSCHLDREHSRGESIPREIISTYAWMHPEATPLPTVPKPSWGPAGSCASPRWWAAPSSPEGRHSPAPRQSRAWPWHQFGALVQPPFYSDIPNPCSERSWGLSGQAPGLVELTPAHS